MRSTAFIFGIFYLLSVTGYGLEFHYCLGEITDVNYALLDTYCHCDDAHQGRIKGCCEEKEFFVQLDQDHQVPADVDLSHFMLPLAAEWQWQDPVETVDTSVSKTIPSRGPPRPVDLYKTNCEFIFYG